MLPKQIILRPLVAQDVEKCIKLAGLAFKGDRNTELKARSVIHPYDHEEGMRAGLAHWLQRAPGTIEMTVAVDGATDEILGWVVWGFRGFESPPADQKQTHQQSNESTKNDEPKSSTRSTRQTEAPSRAKESESMRRRLESYTGEDLNTWMQRLMPPGTKCMYISTIVVSPLHHGKGVGTMLVQQGTNRADEEQVFCWVHSSEAGAALFTRLDFVEVGKLEVDLDAFNSDNVEPPDAQDTRWGTYTFRYMRREPQKSIG